MEWIIMQIRQSNPQKFLRGHWQSTSPTQSATGASSFHFDIEGHRDYTNWFGTDEFSPFANHVNDSTLTVSPEGSYAPESSNKEAFITKQFQETQSLRLPSHLVQLQR